MSQASPKRGAMTLSYTPHNCGRRQEREKIPHDRGRRQKREREDEKKERREKTKEKKKCPSVAIGNEKVMMMKACSNMHPFPQNPKRRKMIYSPFLKRKKKKQESNTR